MKRPAKALQAAPRSLPGRRVALVLALALAAVYANALGNPFVIDDQNSILENRTIRQLLPLPGPLSPPRDTPVAGRPLVNLSFALNYAAGGVDVRGYRAVNLAIHLLATLVLFGAVRRTLGRMSGSPLSANADVIAFVAATLWMLHPLQTEVVNYVTQRTSALKGLLYLSTLYCSIRALDERGRRWPALAILSCAAGMACKESMVTAPVMVVLYDRAFAFRSLRDAMRARRGLYCGLAVTWLVLGALLAGSPRSTVGFGAGVDPWTYLLNQAAVITNYLRLVVLPTALVVDYGVPRALAPVEVIGPSLILLALAAATLVAWRWAPALGFAGAWFFITLAPTSSIVPIVTEVGAERRMYLPLAAIVVLVVCAVARVAASWPVPRTVSAAACIAVALALAAGTVLRNEEYGSTLELARTVVERRPHGRAYLQLATVLIEEGRRPEAFPYIERARRENAVGARFVLGTEYLIDGKLDAGIRELSEFVGRHPDHLNIVPAREMLARAYVERNRLDEAEEQLTELLRIVPNHALAHDVLGSMLLLQGRAADAVPHLAFTAAQQRADVTTLGKLGTALAASGRMDEAIPILQRAVDADPNHAHARTVLGRALADQRRFDEALEHLERAAALAPGNAMAQQDLRAVRAHWAKRKVKEGESKKGESSQIE